MRLTRPATWFLFHVRVLFIALAILLAACARLPGDSTSKTTPIDHPKSAPKQSTININAASAAEMEKLPGIGPVLAERIISHRQENGPFRRTEHLMMVRGLSDRKFREIRSMLTVD